MAKQERVLTGLTLEDYDETETTSAWYIHFMDELDTRKYAEGFNPKMNKVYAWVYKHKDIIWDTPFEEQERMMIADGVLAPEDIYMSDNADEENSDYEEEHLDEDGRTLGLGLEDYMESELISAWHIRFMDELSTRKYGDIFSYEMDRVDEWVYKHRDIIWDTPFEEQERMMIKDGVLTPEDIYMSDNADEENSDYEEEYLDEDGRTPGLGLEDYMETELTSAWHLHFCNELEKRKYGDFFSTKIDKVYKWVYAHRDNIWDTPFEEQERMMIADGVLAPEDI